ncbi:DUF775 domain containing protein [Niveomyces insectorum RCEF 264]|uniref:DUF775 domain containing protein n=1 Tax=Niveomyces insectorum RCEF 264 TaxID=1081102 RepID=A0A168A7P4_9HYPO|nr:DUF775 domain containing protein [Niveomyces insectorum RCEF 264]
MAQPLFGIVPAGLPVLTAPTETPSPTSFIYALPADKAFSHVVIFLLPGVALPPGTAAAIYLVTPPTTPGQTTPTSRFLGGIGPGKESAVFKIGGGGGGGSASASTGTATPTAVGVSVEEAGSVAARMEELRAAQPAPTSWRATAAAAAARWCRCGRLRSGGASLKAGSGAIRRF